MGARRSAQRLALATALVAGSLLQTALNDWASLHSNQYFCISSPPLHGLRPARQLLWRYCRQPTLRSCNGADTILAIGLDDPALEVRWLPPLDRGQSDVPLSGDPNVTVLGVFPLEGPFFPDSEHTLSIFERRYRQLYNDILFSGSRRFVVTAVNPEDSRLAEVGVVFYLNDLRDVSEQSANQVKYVCEHRVIGRVRISRILNPSAWQDGTTYLKAETLPIDDVEEPDTTAEEEAVMTRLQELTLLQEQLDAVQFDSGVSQYVNASRAEHGGFWSFAALWSDYFEHLVHERMGQLQQEVEWKLFRDGGNLDDSDSEDEDEGVPPKRVGNPEHGWGSPVIFGVNSDDELDPNDDDEDEEDEYYYGDGDGDIESYIEEASPELQAEFRKLQGQYSEEAEELELRQLEVAQQLLQSASHRQRLALLNKAIGDEVRRLSARRTLEAVVTEQSMAPRREGSPRQFKPYAD